MSENSKKNILKKILSGFTLVEVFIVLTIIAILCAIVIPTMATNYNKQQYVTRLKRIYNQLNQATEEIKYNNRGSLAGAVGTDSNSLRNVYKTYLNYINACDVGSSGCFYTGTSTWHDLAGNPGWNDISTNDSQLVLKDGTFIGFYFINSNCVHGEFVRNGNNEECAQIDVDVNGAKGPNIYGRDIFMFEITKYGLYPAGNAFDYTWANYCNPSCSGCSYNGVGCADRVLEEGAMNY